MTSGDDGAADVGRASGKAGPAPSSKRKRERKSFPRTLRLRGSEGFTAVLRQGAFAADDTLVVHVLENRLTHNRFGITIPRRTGNAVVRNRWKRLIRESIRHCQHNVPTGYDVVIRPKRDAVPVFQPIERNLPKTIRRAVRRHEKLERGSSGNR